MSIKIDDTPIDTVTIKFWLDQPGPLHGGPKPPAMWCAQIGLNIVEGIGGFGPTPILALKSLFENLERAADENHLSDNRKIPLR